MYGACAESVQVHETSWQPTSITVPLQMELDACFVPSADSGNLRVDVANVVVIDGVLDDQLREALLHLLSDNELAVEPPEALWEKRTVDDASNPKPSWGLKDSELLELKHKWAVVELHSRLQLLYSGVQFFHMPADTMQAHTSSGLEPRHTAAVHGLCEQFVANAAVAGNQFLWHVDADPSNVPLESPWAAAMGPYANREAGRPRFVSLIAYLNSRWDLNEHAETLFLDSASDTGAFVRPKPGRLVLLDQDVLHRASAPAAAAGRPRYSLVWKLLACPAAAAAGGRTTGTRTTGTPASGPTATPTAGKHASDRLDSGETASPRDAAAGGTLAADGGARRGTPGPVEAPGGQQQLDLVAGEAEWAPVERTVSILLPEYGGVTAFGSARKMLDLQEQVAGPARGRSRAQKRTRPRSGDGGPTG